MAKFTDEHKEELKNNYFEEGVHKVKIQAVTLGKTSAPDFKEYMQFDVVGEEGQEDQARIWFTTDKAINYSFNIVRGIFVHNAPESKKESARKAVDAITDTQELEKAAQSLLGKEAWFSVYKNPNRLYTAKDGTQKPSIDRNITGYEPKARPIVAAPVAQSAADLNMPEGSGDDQPFGF